MNKAIKISNKFKNTSKGKTFFFNNIGLKNFKLKRFFIISSNQKKTVRGNHAHKKCDQILTLINGSARIKIFKKTNKIFNLKKYDCIYVPKKHWIEIAFKQNKGSILVLCNHKFDLNEYIFDRNELI
tara:strand:+ start:107 stop:487 length:381 start_codon:yes stop_codon:yes gene_type:complete